MQLEVMAAVFADRDRSVERAVELGISAGIAHERERMRQILELDVPPARGIERAIIIMGLAGSSPDDVRKMADFMATNINAEDLAQQRRSEFRAVAGCTRDSTSAQKLES
ncbi:MAG: hypothetical protein P4L99_05545 [Chthoniobacter sp.]|nr:hypothetical protein [Chthoniobacter sp.]